MAFEAFRVQIAALLDEIAQGPEDPHALQESLRETLAQMTALGLPIPDALQGLEDYLEQDLELPDNADLPVDPTPDPAPGS